MSFFVQETWWCTWQLHVVGLGQFLQVASPFTFTGVLGIKHRLSSSCKHLAKTSDSPVFWDRVSCSLHWPLAPYVTEDDSELLTTAHHHVVFMQCEASSLQQLQAQPFSGLLTRDCLRFPLDVFFTLTEFFSSLPCWGWNPEARTRQGS